MPGVQADQIYRDHDTIVDALIAAMQARVPDIWTQEDGVFRLICEVMAGEIEGNYLANELLRNDMFIQLANAQALDQHGEEVGRPRLVGTSAIGSVRFSGSGGVFIPAGTQVAADDGTDNLIYFDTTADGTIPQPGNPLAPTATLNVTAGNLTGTMEHVVTFYTAEGETVPGPAGAPIVTVAQRVDLTAIPLGGAGTVGRRIYRRKDGGVYKRVTEIADNTTTTYTDNIADGSLGVEPPSVSTAERVTVTAQAEEVGTAGNVVAEAINELVDIPSGISGVTNVAAFTGGTDPEETEEYRSKLLEFVRAPKAGAKEDLEVWAEAVEGVETATAFPNDNLGTPTPGHVTVRIAGANGSVPPGSVVSAVQADLDARDVINITIHVATFTAVPTNVTVNVTEDTGFTLADITPSVTQAIIDYINATPIGGTVYISGIIDAIYGITGVADVTVSVPATNQTSTATQKRTPGTISVT